MARKSRRSRRSRRRRGGDGTCNEDAKGKALSAADQKECRECISQKGNPDWGQEGFGEWLEGNCMYNAGGGRRRRRRKSRKKRRKSRKSKKGGRRKRRRSRRRRR